MRARARVRGARPMARHPGDPRFELSPRGRRVAGWLAALAAVIVVALGVRLIGGGGDDGPEVRGSAGASAPPAIAFGTMIDPETGVVAIAARTDRFTAGDTFAYSVAEVPPARTVYVAVERIGATEALVQPASEQELAPGAPAIAFSVPADVLLEAFGPGEYRMRIHTAADGPPVAEGTFTLDVAGASPGE